MSNLVYPFTLTPGAPENVNQLNANLEQIRTIINGQLDASNLSTSVLQSTTVLTGIQVRDVGEFGQMRAGRVLTIADFTNLGLSAPLGLWNLSNVNDFSGNSRNLTNKGTVGFASGITGAGAEAAQFTGSTAQALYIADTGAADPFRIKTGSWGAWFRLAKRGTTQYIISKITTPGGNADISWGMYVGNNVLGGAIYAGAIGQAVGVTDVADDRWHMGIETYDGTRLRVYVDGALEASAATSGPIAPTTFGPVNIGGYAADASTATPSPFYGRVDEAFVTSDVLSDDQVRNLYLGSISHSLGATPKTVRMRVTRRRRGGPFVALDFPATPSRLYNFAAGALTDDGANATAVTNAGTAPILVAGPDGVKDTAYQFGSNATAHFVATDTGLPSGLSARTLGCWVKTAAGFALGGGMVGYGSGVSISTSLLYIDGAGFPTHSGNANGVTSSTKVNDSLWHFVVAVADNASVDGLKNKIYVDGRLSGSSTLLDSVTLGGAGRFRIGAYSDGGGPIVGQIAHPFIYAGAMTDVQVRALYNKGSQALAPSPKYEGDHIESLELTRMLATFDSIEATDLIDMEVLT